MHGGGEGGKAQTETLLTPGIKDNTRLFQSFTAVAGTVWIENSRRGPPFRRGMGPRRSRELFGIQSFAVLSLSFEYEFSLEFGFSCGFNYDFANINRHSVRIALYAADELCLYNHNAYS